MVVKDRLRPYSARTVAAAGLSASDCGCWRVRAASCMMPSHFRPLHGPRRAVRTRPCRFPRRRLRGAGDGVRLRVRPSRRRGHRHRPRPAFRDRVRPTPVKQRIGRLVRPPLEAQGFVPHKRRATARSVLFARGSLPVRRRTDATVLGRHDIAVPAHVLHREVREATAAVIGNPAFTKMPERVDWSRLAAAAAPAHLRPPLRVFTAALDHELCEQDRLASDTANQFTRGNASVSASRISPVQPGTATYGHHATGSCTTTPPRARGVRSGRCRRLTVGRTSSGAGESASPGKNKARSGVRALPYRARPRRRGGSGSAACEMSNTRSDAARVSPTTVLVPHYSASKADPSNQRLTFDRCQAEIEPAVKHCHGSEEKTPRYLYVPLPPPILALRRNVLPGSVATRH